MSDESTPREALIDELQRLRQRLGELESSDGQLRQAQDDLRRRVEEHTARFGASLQAEIDQRRQAEARLEDSEARFRRVFEYSNDAIFLLDPGLNELLDVNPRASLLLEYTREELLGLPLSVLFADEVVRLQAFALSVVEEGSGWMEELACRTRTGHRLAAEMSASAIELAGRTCIIALLRDITERKRTEGQILSDLRHKEILLREVHHRVKNNLQIVASLLALQAGQTSDAGARRLFDDCRNRVGSIALIHEQLYRAHDLAHVDLREYVRTLAEQIFRSYGVAPRAVQLVLEVEVGHLDVEQAIPCGLIVNELVSNALKYGFPGGRRGRVGIGLRRGDDDQLCLRVWDDGVGFPEEADLGASPSLGLRLVDSLVHQLGGHLDLDRRTGAA
ncbi:MAG: histidine kinase dimerization/phosphoacceptor domain -containing protein, partial [Gemmatimonadota bacterium]